jgi:hypothetical protein
VGPPAGSVCARDRVSAPSVEAPTVETQSVEAPPVEAAPAPGLPALQGDAVRRAQKRSMRRSAS